ncbi:MAG: hypothetical protein JNM55_13270 [Anaerolineales bacterium]|nr:hypothetical protein [Anaerolineales bacterium]
MNSRARAQIDAKGRLYGCSPPLASENGGDQSSCAITPDATPPNAGARGDDTAVTVNQLVAGELTSFMVQAYPEKHLVRGY